MSLSVVVAGASGFLGTHLVEALRARDHDVVRLVRRPARSADESQWDPYADRVDRGLVGGADVVVNLAGHPLVGNPHSKKWAREVRHSRVTTTGLLAETIAAGERQPAFLAGNGIAFYGDHGAEVLTEQADSRGDALLTSVSREWQEATTPAAEAGSRVVVLRTSPVMDRQAPPLQQLRLLFKTGLGGRLGSGAQHFPMISRRDWVDAVVFAAEQRTLAGPVNLCAPSTPTNAEFTRALADLVHRPAPIPVPSPLIRLGAGELAPELLGSVNARPAALEAAGYTFHDHDVRDVLATGLA